ncbi:GlsB/YeaQ/YmgE family stress response membrane protein [Arenimonas sp. MALMAid1274]|uniref:GlsB/YeaQ/YmgE family stress response membrane protein n=1 Tax=Arenimonas sp. MALMAid1274 TaxID=3411630 RepID=UPI003BA10350
MSVENLLIFLLIGALAGWLAGVVVKGRGLGVLGNIVVGVIGAFLGGWLLPQLGVSFGGTVGLFLTAFIGAVILLAIILLIKRA